LAVYNRVSEQRLDEEQHRINKLLVKFGTVDRSPGSGRRSAHTHENVDTVESLMKKNLRATEQSEKYHLKQGIHRSSVSQIIHKDLRIKCYKKGVLNS